MPLPTLINVVWYGPPPPLNTIPTRIAHRAARRLFCTHPFCDCRDCIGPRHTLIGGPCTNALELLNHKFGSKQPYQPAINALNTLLRRDGYGYSNSGVMEYWYQEQRGAGSRKLPSPQGPPAEAPGTTQDRSQRALELIETLRQAAGAL